MVRTQARNILLAALLVGLGQVVAGTTAYAGLEDDEDWLVPSFSGDGRAEAPFSAFSAATAIATSANRIVVAGYVTSDSGDYENDFALAAFTRDGELDASFGDDGMIQTSIRRQDQAVGIGFQPDGRLVAVGGAGRWYSSGPRAYAFARYLT